MKFITVIFFISLTQTAQAKDIKWIWKIDVENQKTHQTKTRLFADTENNLFLSETKLCFVSLDKPIKQKQMATINCGETQSAANNKQVAVVNLVNDAGEDTFKINIQAIKKM